MGLVIVQSVRWAEKRHIQLLTFPPLCARDIACCRPAWTRSCRWLSNRMAVRVLLRHQSWLIVGHARVMALHVPGHHTKNATSFVVKDDHDCDRIVVQDDGKSSVTAASEREFGRPSVRRCVWRSVRSEDRRWTQRVQNYARIPGCGKARL